MSTFRGVIGHGQEQGGGWSTNCNFSIFLHQLPQHTHALLANQTPHTKCQSTTTTIASAGGRHSSPFINYYATASALVASGHSTTTMCLSTTSPKECTLLIPVTTSINDPLYIAPIQHTTRVTAAIAIMGVDLADLHSHLPQKSTFLTLNIHEFPSLLMVMHSMNAKYTLYNNQMG